MVSLEVFLRPNIAELMYLCRQHLGFVITKFVLKPMVRISGAICIVTLFALSSLRMLLGETSRQ